MLAAVVVALAIAQASGGRTDDRSAHQCAPHGSTVRVTELPEASGVAASRRVPGRVWALNDSGRPLLVALNDAGEAVGTVQVEGVEVGDWEAMAVGPCPAGSCLYVADIGDNDAERERISIYRVPEPDGSAESIRVRDVFQATYPDGAHDAETLLVTPHGDLFIVTKGETGPVGLYRFPTPAQPGAVVELIRVGTPRDESKAAPDDRITDGAVSPDGRWIVLRTTRALHVHRAADLTAGTWQEGERIDLAAIGEPQGEGVTFASDTLLYLVGEGGGKSRSGTFARLSCTF